MDGWKNTHRSTAPQPQSSGSLELTITELQDQVNFQVTSDQTFYELVYNRTSVPDAVMLQYADLLFQRFNQERLIEERLICCLDVFAPVNTLRQPHIINFGCAYRNNSGDFSGQTEEKLSEWI